MINRERNGDKSIPSIAAAASLAALDEVSSPRLDRVSDADDSDDSATPSSYSSCGESRLERYSSANSVLGSASLSSSFGTCNEFLGSDTGSIRNFARGRASGSKSGGATSRSLDSLSDRGNEFREENVGFGDKILFRQFLFSDCGGKSEENRDEISMKGGAGGEIKSQQSSLRCIQSCEVGCQENEEINKIASEFGNDEKRDEIPVSQSGANGFKLLPNASRNYPSYVAIASAKKFGDSYLSADGNGLYPLHRSGEESLSRMNTEEEKMIEKAIRCAQPKTFSSNEHEFSDLEKCVQNDRSQSVTAEELNAETSLRCEFSDAEDSSLDYGTEDEERASAVCRNLKYLKESKSKDENMLVMNAVSAFGSDDWEDYEQETLENMAHLSWEKPPEQNYVQLETEKSQLGVSNCRIVGDVAAQISDEAGQDVPVVSYEIQDIKESSEKVCDPSLGNFFLNMELPTQNACVETCHGDKSNDFPSASYHLTVKNDILESKMQCFSNEQHVGLPFDYILKTESSDISEPPVDPLSNHSCWQLQPSPIEEYKDTEQRLCIDHKPSTHISSTDTNHHVGVMQTANALGKSMQLDKDPIAPAEVEKPGTDVFYDDMVHEMEEILLDSGRLNGTRLSHASQRSSSQLSQSLRDGGSTASTSGMDDVYPQLTYPLKIDWVEVVGAKRKKGGVSFGERLVGVKEYTLYVIRVWSNKDHWEVERRYRDFYTLYCQLKTLFTDSGRSLPSPWSSIDRESRKIFGNASPNVISERSLLIQDCIQSILDFSHYDTPSSLICFLSPSKPLNSSNAIGPHSIPKFAEEGKSKFTSTFSGVNLAEGFSYLGSTITLLVEIKPQKSVEQLLDEQLFSCAGCHNRLDTGKSLMQGFINTFGWGKPRLCEYTGQLFCASCHTNDTAVLPAKVLHLWDFSLYPVSQLTKAYLESIYDQPMLCVSAVNPFLFSKVPNLQRVMSIRKKIGAMFPCLQCPFRRCIQRGMGTRRYLLESNEFFALRDLVDLSKGAFSALPAMIETLSKKIFEHITQQCLLCCDLGIPCCARQACEDPASLIFPFQESEVTRCHTCNSVFHRSCFRKLVNCPCSGPREAGVKVASKEVRNHIGRDEVRESDKLTWMPDSSLPLGFFSDLWKPRKSTPVISMGSLPSTAL